MDKAVTEDEVRRSEEEIQKLTDKAIKDVDEVVKAQGTGTDGRLSGPP